MDVADALEVIHHLRDAGVPSWVAGGWAVDALVGRQTRVHRDLDLAFPADLDAVAIETLGSLGYEVAVDERPARFEMRATGGRSVDFHPVRLRSDGSGTQQGFDGVSYEYPADGFATGLLDGVTVTCLGPDRLVAFHQGYEPTVIDYHDMHLLRDECGVSLPEPYA